MTQQMIEPSAPVQDQPVADGRNANLRIPAGDRAGGPGFVGENFDLEGFDLLTAGPVEERLESPEAILFTLAQMVEHRDANTAGHCERLAHAGLRMGRALGLSASELCALHRGGYLHDIGKISVPDRILFKEGPLTPAEWTIMQDHTVNGEEICRHLRSLTPVLPIIRSHHERWDGSGYPDGRRGEETPLLARIIQIADIYDALTSKRPYKPALSPAEAVEILLEETGRGWRDPELVALFIDLERKALRNGRNAQPELYLLNLRLELGATAIRPAPAGASGTD